MNKSRSGFTIVELLIVIVVIGILAAVTIVAFNGIQTRAKNTKTVSATTAWIKALKLYNADTGSWPTTYSCLGTTTTYVGSGGQCWPDPAWTVKPAFLSSIQPYISKYPEPDTSDIVAGTASSPMRGALYTTNNVNNWQIYIFLLGSIPCPELGITFSTSASGPSGKYCIYNLV